VAGVECAPAETAERRRRAGAGGGGDEAGNRALVVVEVVDETEEGRPAVALAVAAAKGWVGDDPEPGLADEGGADEVRGLVRRDPEQDLVHQLQRRGRVARRRRHGGGGGAARDNRTKGEGKEEMDGRWAIGLGDRRLGLTQGRK